MRPETQMDGQHRGREADAFRDLRVTGIRA